LGRGIRSLDAKELHRLRICIKKLRYASEFFEELWAKAARENYVGALKRLQDELGEVQDAESATRLIGDIGEKQGYGGRQAREWAKALRKRARRRTMRYWSEFRDAPRFWQLP
jgi:CHAD domain-containing protein